MALIKCSECGREVSDKSDKCIGCGAPISIIPISDQIAVPTSVSYDNRNDFFHGTKPLVARLCARAIADLNWKVDGIDEVSGLVSFTTGMTWGSFSGVSGSILIEEIEINCLRVRGTAKQNVRGGQIAALNLFDEAGKKVAKVIQTMREIAPPAKLG